MMFSDPQGVVGYGEFSECPGHSGIGEGRPPTRGGYDTSDLCEVLSLYHETINHRVIKAELKLATKQALSFELSDH